MALVCLGTLFIGDFLWTENWLAGGSMERFGYESNIMEPALFEPKFCV